MNAWPDPAQRTVQSDALGVALWVPAALVERASDHSGLTLVRPAAGPTDFEVVQLSRRRQRRSEGAADWHAACSRLAAEGGWRDILLGPLQSYPVAGHAGALGVMRFTDGAGVVTGAALWCGQVDDDTVTLLYRCGLAREPFFAAAVGGMLDSLAFAEGRQGNRTGTAHARQPRPGVVFGLNLAVAIILVLVGLWLRNA